MKDFGNYMNEAILLLKIAKKLDLDAADYEMLIHDVHNLRGKEWIEEVESLGDDNLLEEFKELINYKNGEDEEEL